jgi:Homeodomain-like domain
MPRRVTHATRVALVWLSYGFNWQPALTVVPPETFKRWRRQGWRLLWQTPSRSGRPPIPPELRALIRQMARENLTWGQQRIANELRLKLGLQVSPRTVRKYMPSGCDRGLGPRVQGQCWRTFMRNHAGSLIRTDLSMVLSRRWHISLRRAIELLQCWQCRFTAEEWRRATPSEAPSMFVRRPTRPLCLEDSAYAADVPRVAQRSPPTMGPSRIRSRISAGTPLGMADIRPVEWALYQGKLARAHACGAELWCRGRNHAVLLCRVA